MVEAPFVHLAVRSSYSLLESMLTPKVLAAWAKAHSVPAIAVATGVSVEDQKDLVDRAGFDGFLRKPYSIVELLETVERMIDG